MARTDSKTAYRVAYHDEACSPLNRLPFVVDGNARLKHADCDIAHWALPAAGGYIDGCAAGTIAATAYIKMLRSADGRRGVGGRLQHVALSMAHRLARLKPRSLEMDAMHGHMVGFFAALDAWLSTAALCFGSKLDMTGEAEICAQLQDAIDCGPGRRWREKLAQEQSDRARHAAKVRWAHQSKRVRRAVRGRQKAAA